MNGGLILAAGAGRRFGGRKQLADLDGRPLLQHAIDAMLRTPAVDRVVVVLGSAADEVEAAVAVGKAETVRCADWQDGMSASLRCGVGALAGADRVVVTLGDQPRITPAVIGAVLAAAERGDGAARAAYDGTPGHPVVLDRVLLERVGELHGDVGARDLLRGGAVRAVEVGHLCDPTDVDTPEELEALQT